MAFNWASEHETVLAEWADKSNCYNWLHTKCNEKFHSLHIWYTIPVIVMSTLTGTANFAQSQIPINYRNYATMLIGTINIFAGIITTIQQFLKINELNESHRVAAIGWDKFYRRIKIELSKNPDERQPVLDFFNSATDEYDRLMATSPMIEHDILKLFQKTFGDTFSADFSKPEICNSLISVRSTMYKKSDADKKEQIMKDLVGDIIITQTERQDSKTKLIKEFYDKFQHELKRTPTEHELIDNLIRDPSVHDLSITEDMIHAYLEEL